MIIGNIKCKDITPLMTSNTEPSPYVVNASSKNNPVYNMFDNNDETYYRSNINFTTGWISIDFGKKNVIDCYTLRNSYNALWSMNSWTFEGSNDNSTWDVLHTVINKQDWNVNETYTFFFNNLNEYRYYRINCTAKNGQNSICISEMKLYKSLDISYVIEKINENNLPTNVSDGNCHIYFTNSGSIYVTDNFGIPNIMNERILGLNLSEISKFYFSDDIKTGFEKMFEDTTLINGDFVKADNWVYKIIDNTPTKIININPVTRDVIYEGLVNSNNTTYQFNNGCNISDYDMLEIHIIATYSKANYENVILRPIQKIATSNKMTIYEIFGGSTSYSFNCEFTYTDTSFITTKLTSTSSLTNKGISKIIGIKYNR